MKNPLLLVLAFTASILCAQEVCESPDDSLEDLNSITKCTIEPGKKEKNNRQISVRVSAPKRRFLKKRKVAKGVASSIDGANTSGIADVNHSSVISKSLELRKSIANLKNTLSAAEVRVAEKFTQVDELPLFNECKDARKKDQLYCFNTEMIKHIQEHFNYPSEAMIKKIQGNVWVRFVIDTNGDVTNIKTLGPANGELLNFEAKRVVSKLPKFIPAIKKGEKTIVKYGFPITFSLEE